MGLLDNITKKAKEAAAAASKAYDGLLKDSDASDGTTGHGSVDLKEWSKSLTETLTQYSSRFNVDEMWDKLKATASKAGQDIVMMTLTMFYTIRDCIKGSQVVNNVKNGVPVSDVLLMTGAIAYFVCPADLIPDWIVGIGFTDDLAALTYAYKKASRILSVAAKGTAMEKTSELLGKNFDPKKAALLTSKYM